MSARPVVCIALGLSVGLAALVLPKPAAALLCGPARTEVWPRPDDPAPRNVQIHVNVREGSPIPVIVEGEAPVPSRNQRPADDALLVRPVRGDHVGEPVEVSVTRVEGMRGDLRFVTPTAPLAAHTTYELALRGEDRTRRLGTFTTIGKTRAHAPRWDGIGEARWLRPVNWSQARIRLLTEGVKAPRGAIRFAIWQVDDTVNADDPPTSPPDAIRIMSGDGTVTVGGRSDCTPPTLPLPDKGAVRLLVRPMDLAGNLGKADIVTVTVPDDGHERQLPTR